MAGTAYAAETAVIAASTSIIFFFISKTLLFLSGFPNGSFYYDGERPRFVVTKGYPARRKK
jgi:hypothetical protein